MEREPRVVLMLLGLAVVGQAARFIVGNRSSPPGQILAAPQDTADPARQRQRAERLARPLRTGETIDLNTAPAEEIARLPRIGMSLAKRIVEDRIARGPFGGLEDLDRVPGVGRALLAALADRVSFGGIQPGRPISLKRANPGISEGYGPGTGPTSQAPVDLNSASLADLVALPGIGKARARAILAYRRDHGSFAAVSDLGRVPGFSQSLVGRLAPHLTVR